MVLAGIEIDSVDAPWAGGVQIIEQVISSRGYAQNHVIRIDVQKAPIHSRVFPSERVDELIIELCMLCKGFIVVYAVVAVLVESRRQWKIRAQIHHS